MKKLLFIINTMGRAGAETALINLLKRLSALNEYDISLYAMIPRGELFRNVPESIHILNRHPSVGSVMNPAGRLFIVSYLLRIILRKGTGLLMLPELIRNLREQKRSSGRIQPDKAVWRLLAQSTPPPRESYDLAIAYLEGSATYYLAEKVQARRKAAFIHIDYGKAGYTKSMDLDCYTNMDRIFAVSWEVRDRFLDIYPEHKNKMFIFRNLLDREHILHMAQLPGFTDAFDGIRLVTVGRLHYQKACDIAIQACARLREDGYAIRWYVIGEGGERANLERMISSYKLQNHFFLMGALANPYPYIAMADIYVHATRFEGKSIAIEEAQILGRPIVASDCTGNREQIINGYDGVLCQLTVDDLVKQIEALIDSPTDRLRLQQNVARKKLDYPEDMENLLSLAEDQENT